MQLVEPPNGRIIATYNRLLQRSVGALFHQNFMQYQGFFCAQKYFFFSKFTVYLHFNLFYDELLQKYFMKLFRTVSTCKRVDNTDTMFIVCILSCSTAVKYVHKELK
jgi:hypothetical protein